VSFNVHNWSSGTFWGILIGGIFFVFVGQAITGFRQYWACCAAVIVAADVAIFFLFAHYDPAQKNTSATQPPAAESPASQPAPNQSATSSGNNSPNIQADRGSTVNYTVNSGVTDQTLQQIKDGIIALQKQKEDELKKTFSGGYIVFGVTERQEIVPIDSPWDRMISIDWKAGYQIAVNNKAVTISLPKTVYTPPNGAGMIEIGKQRVAIPKRIAPFPIPFIVAAPDYRIGFKYIGDFDNSEIIALGLQLPPLPPAPTMAEFMKYNN
jgi:hypothetical protein